MEVYQSGEPRAKQEFASHSDTLPMREEECWRQQKIHIS